MKEMEVVFLNGEFLKKDEAKISVFDRGFIFGDGVYEVVPVVESKLVDKEQFYSRLSRSLEACELEFSYEKEELFKLLLDLVKRNSLKEGGVYLQVTRGVASRDFFYTNTKPTFMAFAFEEEILEKELVKKGVSVISVPDIRWKRRDIKSISLLGQCMAKNEAKKAKAFEAVMVENSLVTEGSSSNISIIKDGVLITKPVSNEILAGIRRGNIIKIAKSLGIKVEERAFSLSELKAADEAFMSSATLLLMPITKVDKELVNGGVVGKLSLEIRKAYVNALKEEAACS